MVDAIVTKVREDGRVRSRGLLLAFGVNKDGYRELLGLHAGDSEPEAILSEFFASLKQKGLRGVELIVSDQHSGLFKAIRTHYQSATWQRCHTNFMHNILDKTPKALKDELYSKLRAILDAPDIQTGRLLYSKTFETYQDKILKAMESLENVFDDATAVLMLPEKYRKRLRTTNAMEQLNQEIRRQERVIRIFPNLESLVRLIGALLIEFDKKWVNGRCYLDLAEFDAWQKDWSKDAKKVTRIV